jgi:hypothetical protein
MSAIFGASFQWDKAGPNQPMAHLVRLLARQRAYMLRIGQQQRDRRFQDIPHRLPVRSGAFHRGDVAARLREPRGQLFEFGGHRPEPADLHVGLTVPGPHLRHAVTLFLWTSIPQHT